MAIAFDNSASTSNLGISPLAVNLTIGSITNGIVWVGFNTNSSNPNAPSATVGVTAMSLVESSLGAGQNTYLFKLETGSTSGLQVVTVTYTVDDGNLSQIYAASYSGASQTGQPDNHGNTTNGANPLTETLITVADNCWMAVMCGGARNPVASTNSTARSSLGAGAKYFDNNTNITPAGSYTMTQTVTGTGNSAAFASFSPAGGAVATSLRHDFTLLGVGT